MLLHHEKRRTASTKPQPKAASCLKILEMKVTVIVKKGERFFVAEALEVDVVSQGRTPEEALRNIKEALELYFEGEEESELEEVVQITT